MEKIKTFMKENYLFGNEKFKFKELDLNENCTLNKVA